MVLFGRQLYRSASTLVPTLVPSPLAQGGGGRGKEGALYHTITAHIYIRTCLCSLASLARMGHQCKDCLLDS